MSDPFLSSVSPIRANAAAVRNPLLGLPAAQRIASLPPEARQVLADLLQEHARDARDRAERSWRRRKAPMAAYWLAVGVYAGHLRRIVRPSTRRGGRGE